MIARVRIAPVENWCANTRGEIEERVYSPGTVVEIETSSWTPNDSEYSRQCGGGTFRLSLASTNMFRVKAGKEPQNHCGYFCEHMLEID